MTIAPIGAASGEEQLQAAVLLLRSAITSVQRPVSSAVESLLAETAAQINQILLPETEAKPKPELEPKSKSIDDLLTPKVENSIKPMAGLAAVAKPKAKTSFTQHRIATIQAAQIAAGEVLEKILANRWDRKEIDRLIRQLGNGLADAQKQHQAYLRKDTDKSGRDLAAIEARAELKRLISSSYTDGSVHIARGYELAPIGEQKISIPIAWIGTFETMYGSKQRVIRLGVPGLLRTFPTGSACSWCEHAWPKYKDEVERRIASMEPVDLFYELESVRITERGGTNVKAKIVVGDSWKSDG